MQTERTPREWKQNEIEDMNDLQPGDVITDHPLGPMPVVYCYTRQDALQDGTLHDVTFMAKGLISGPVAVTDAVWSMIQAIPKSRSWQDVPGRTHDVLWMAALGLARIKSVCVRIDGPGDVLYRLSLDRVEAGRMKTRCTLRARIHGDDQGKRCVTISLPDED